MAECTTSYELSWKIKVMKDKLTKSDRSSVAMQWLKTPVSPVSHTSRTSLGTRYILRTYVPHNRSEHSARRSYHTLIATIYLVLAVIAIIYLDQVVIAHKLEGLRVDIK